MLIGIHFPFKRLHCIRWLKSLSLFIPCTPHAPGRSVGRCLVGVKLVCLTWAFGPPLELKIIYSSKPVAMKMVLWLGPLDSWLREDVGRVFWQNLGLDACLCVCLLVVLIMKLGRYGRGKTKCLTRLGPTKPLLFVACSFLCRYETKLNFQESICMYVSCRDYKIAKKSQRVVPMCHYIYG